MIEKLQGHPFIRHGDFRLLFIARLISAIGDKFFFLALVWFVLGWDDPHKLVYVGLVSAMTILPTVIFGPFMGTIVDRINRKKCLLLADIVRTLFMAIFCIPFMDGSIQHRYHPNIRVHHHCLYTFV